MADIKNTITSYYKADTSDIKRKIRELSGEEKKRHKEMLGQMEAQNKKIDDQIAFWGKVAVGVGAAVGAFKLLDAGFETYEKNSRLRAANVNTDIGGLQKATRGLVDETRLLEFSAAAMNGTFALTQKETEGVLQGALALRKTMGIDLAEAMDRVKQAVNEANGEALKPLGITIKETTGTAGAQEAIIRALGDEYQKLGGDVNLASDDVTRAKTSFADSMDSLRENLGKIAIALAPIVQALADIVGFIAQITPTRVTGGVDANRLLSEAQKKLQRGRAFSAALNGDTSLLSELGGSSVGPNSGGLGGASALQMAAALGLLRKRKGGGGGGFNISGSEVDGVTPRRLGVAEQGAGGILGGDTLPGSFLTPGAAPDAPFNPGFTEQDREQAQQALARAMATVTEQTIRSSQAFQSFESVVVSAFASMASGAESFTSAMRKALAGEAINLGMLSIRKAAYAVAEGIFTGNPQRFAAAAGYTAAGVGLMALGRGLGGAGGGGASAPSVSGIGAGARGGGGGGTQVFLLGEGFTDRTSRERVADFRRAGRRAGLSFSGDAVEQR